MAEPDTTPEAPVTPAEPAAVSGLLDDVIGLSQEVRELAHDQLQLVALEARVAAESLLTMIAAAVGIGLLVVTSWFGLMGAFVWWLGSVGVAIWVGMVAVAILNLLAASILYRLIRRRGESLGFPATLRSLRAAWSRPDTAKVKSQ